MFYAGIVRGSKEASAPLIVNVDTVYVHKNIKEVEVIDETRPEEEPRIEYEYEEWQYKKDEYIQMIAEQNETLTEELTAAQEALDVLIMDDEKDNRIAALEEQLAATQEAVDSLIMGE